MAKMKCPPEHIAALASEFTAPYRHNPRSKAQCSPRLNFYDAMATLLVSQSRKQVVAVGIQPDLKNKRYTLVVSSNYNVGVETGRHALDVWAKLKAYAECYHGCSDPVRAASCREVLAQRTDEFILPVYRFCFPRLLHYLQKPCGGKTRLRVFLEFATHPSASGHAAQFFNLIATQLYWSSQDLAAHDARESVNDNVLKAFVNGIDAIYDAAAKFFGDRETVNLIPQFEAVIGFDPIKFLQQIVSFSVAAKTLMALVISDMTYITKIKDHDLDVKILTSRNVTIKLPEPNESVQYADFFLQGYDVLPMGLLPVEMQPGYRLTGGMQRRMFVQNAVHPTCRVAAHLLRENRRRVQSLAYIGTSRQSCLACVHFVRSLTSVDKVPIFCVRENYSLRARFPWKYPNMEIEGAGRTKAYLKESLVRFLIGMGWAYSRQFASALQILSARLSERRMRQLMDSDSS